MITINKSLFPSSLPLSSLFLFPFHVDSHCKTAPAFCVLHTSPSMSWHKVVPSFLCPTYASSPTSSLSSPSTVLVIAIIFFPYLQAVQDSAQHSVSYTLSRNKAIIVEYMQDNDTDMFQIGRSSEGPIDFVVMDTIPGYQRNSRENVTQSTISRFACRIIVDRNPPYTAKIFAAGFDSARNIFLGVRTCIL